MSDEIVTKEDLLYWDQSPVTKIIKAGFQARVEELQEALGTNAGIDPLLDRFHAGYIAGLKDAIATRSTPDED